LVNTDIKAFTVTGKVSGDKFIKTRERLLHDIESGMRDEGYVPHLDLKELFTRSMDAEGNFDFELTIYGIYVGEEQSTYVAGVTDGKEVMSVKSTVQTK